jgi:hypothetical protein
LISLARLGLNDTRVTDAGLSHLKALTKLKNLSIARSQVTDDGIAELSRSLPGLTVDR